MSREHDVPREKHLTFELTDRELLDKKEAAEKLRIMRETEDRLIRELIYSCRSHLAPEDEVQIIPIKLKESNKNEKSKSKAPKKVNKKLPRKANKAAVASV